VNLQYNRRYGKLNEDWRRFAAVSNSSKGDVFMHRICFLILPILLFVSTSVWGEFYKYTDKDGNVHFTDDYNQVPVDQRENVTGYREHVTDETAGAVTAPAAPGDPDAPQPSVSRNSGNAGLDAVVQELDRRKAALAREYEALIRENERLAEIKKNIQTTEETARYNEQVKQLNAKIRAHDQKRKQWFNDVEAYNAQVAEQSQKGKK
jgi:hypothetical protein